MVTVVLGVLAATRLTLNASFEKMIPQSQPYIKNYLDNQQDLRGLGNSMRVVVENTEGDIFDPQYLDVAAADQRRAVPDAGRGPRLGEVALDAGGALDRGHRGGLPGRAGDAGQLRRLAAERSSSCKQNIARSGIVGSLVGNDFKSSMIFVPLLDKDPTHRQAHRLPRPVASRSRTRSATSTRRPAQRQARRQIKDPRRSASPSWSAT